MITFADAPRLAVRFTANLELLAGGLAGLEAQGETRFFDSLAFALFFQGHAGPATPIRFAQDQIIGVIAGGPVVKPTAQDTTPPPPKAPKPLKPRPAFLEP